MFGLLGSSAPKQGDCVYTSLIGNSNVDYEDLKSFQRITKKWDYFLASVHIIFFAGLISYIVGSILRKRRHSTFQWAHLFSLCIIQLLEIFKFMNFFGLGHGDHSNCYFWDHICFGVIDILLFNLSIMMGFKFYSVTNNLFEFAVKGNLPSRGTILRNKIILNAIWFVFVADGILYIFLNTYWTFFHRDIQQLRIFNFGNRIA